MDSVKNADLSSTVKTNSATNLAASSAKRATTLMKASASLARVSLLVARNVSQQTDVFLA